MTHNLSGGVNAVVFPAKDAHDGTPGLSGIPAPPLLPNKPEGIRVNAQVYIIAIIGAYNGTGNVINSATSLLHGFGGAA